MFSVCKEAWAVVLRGKVDSGEVYKILFYLEEAFMGRKYKEEESILERVQSLIS